MVIQTAESRGVMTAGHNASQANLAPKGFITGAEYKWGTIYTGFAKLLAAGQPLPNVTFGGYDKDMVQSTPFGAAATDKCKTAVNDAIAGAQGRQADLREAGQGQQGQPSCCPTRPTTSTPNRSTR